MRNTSYKVQADVDTEQVRLQYEIEEGAYVTTSAGGTASVWDIIYFIQKTQSYA
jgi:hypothetical protein